MLSFLGLNKIQVRCILISWVKQVVIFLRLEQVTNVAKGNFKALW